MKEISSKYGIGHIGDHENPTECSAKAQIELEKTLPECFDV